MPLLMMLGSGKLESSMHFFQNLKVKCMIRDQLNYLGGSGIAAVSFGLDLSLPWAGKHGPTADLRAAHAFHLSSR